MAELKHLFPLFYIPHKSMIAFIHKNQHNVVFKKIVLVSLLLINHPLNILFIVVNMNLLVYCGKLAQIIFDDKRPTTPISQ